MLEAASCTCIIPLVSAAQYASRLVVTLRNSNQLVTLECRARFPKISHSDGPLTTHCPRSSLNELDSIAVCCFVAGAEWPHRASTSASASSTRQNHLPYRQTRYRYSCCCYCWPLLYRTSTGLSGNTHYRAIHRVTCLLVLRWRAWWVTFYHRHPLSIDRPKSSPPPPTQRPTTGRRGEVSCFCSLHVHPVHSSFPSTPRRPGAVPASARAASDDV